MSSATPEHQRMAMQVLGTDFDAVKLYVPEFFEDDRGFFKETYNARRYKNAGLTDDFIQDSVSLSERNVLRGLHYQPGMSKLVQVLHGKIFDVVVDLRAGSATRGRWQGFYLSDQNHRQLYVPDGFCNGFLALTDQVLFSYKHGALYDASREAAIRWDDPTLGIDWPLVGQARLSKKDRAAPCFQA